LLGEHFPAEVSIPTVLDVAFLSAIEAFGNGCPVGPQLLEFLDEEIVFGIGPRRIFVLRAEIVRPAVSALAGGPPFDLSGDRHPTGEGLLGHRAA
jgi:hypothetical protein